MNALDKKVKKHRKEHLIFYWMFYIVSSFYLNITLVQNLSFSLSTELILI